MRVNSGVNPATPFTTDDPSTPGQDAAPSTVAQELDAPSQSTGNDKRFEGQLDAFLVRSHLDSGRDEVASGTKATLPTSGHISRLWRLLTSWRPCRSLAKSRPTSCNALPK